MERVDWRQALKWVWIWGDQKSGRYRRRIGTEVTRVVCILGASLSYCSQELRCQKGYVSRVLWKKSPSVYEPVHILSKTGAVKRDVWGSGKTCSSCRGHLTHPGLRGCRVQMCMPYPVQAPAALTDGAKTQPGSVSRTGPGCFDRGRTSF